MENHSPFDKNRAAFERNENRNVFVIMRYVPGPPLSEIEGAIRETLRRHNLNPIVAREVAFDEELWGNIRFCMDHCRYAIVVAERFKQPEHNPNVTLELGYMLALRRPCLILKEQSMPLLPSDIIGRLYTPFDPFNAAETVAAAVEDWLRKLGHTPCPSAQTITGPNHIESNKERTQRILDALGKAQRIIRQAAALSSLAISDTEGHEQDDDGTYQGLLLLERHRILHLLGHGCIVRIVICPVAQVERVESGAVPGEYVKRNILPRYDQLARVIEGQLHNQNLQIVCTGRLPHDNLLIVDDQVLFIGRKRRRDRGFPYTTQIFDPTVIRDEASEFDAIFDDNVGMMLGATSIEDRDYGSPELKDAVLERLKKHRGQVARIARSKTDSDGSR